MRRINLSILCVFLGCSAPKPIPGVIQLEPGKRLTSVPGPMPGFGPFAKASDALLAACSLILQEPHALAGRPADSSFKLRWQLSTEYCAWLYYTPDDKYEMSLLVTNSVQDDPRMRRCDLPPWVDDQRYSQDALGYVFMLHNHPYASELSDHDFRSIVGMAQVHGAWTVKTKMREIPVGIVAFFSRSMSEPAECDGFFQYFPITGEVMRWVVQDGVWEHKQIASVTWMGPDQYRIERK